MEYFILGMLTVQALFPILDALTAVIITGLEALKGFFGMKITEYNSRIRAMTEQDKSSNKSAIGFRYEEEEEDDE